MTKRLLQTGLALAALLSVAAGPAPRASEPTTASSPAATAAPVNLQALHDASSPAYNADCLSCHAAVLKETSLDPRVPSIHQTMIPYTPGFNPRHGVSNATCVQCHRSVDLRNGSAAGLRVQVNCETCALCHRPSGPGKTLYR